MILLLTWNTQVTVFFAHSFFQGNGWYCSFYWKYDICKIKCILISDSDTIFKSVWHCFTIYKNFNDGYQMFKIITIILLIIYIAQWILEQEQAEETQTSRH